MQTLTLKNQKARDIEINGVHFKVRSLGVGEMLTLGQVQKRLNKVQSVDSPSDKESEVMFDAMNDMINLVKGAMDDMKDGVETDKLLNSLDPEELGLLMEQLFNRKQDGAATA